MIGRGGSAFRRQAAKILGINIIFHSPSATSRDTKNSTVVNSSLYKILNKKEITCPLSLFYRHFCHYSFSLPRKPELVLAHLHVLATEKPRLASEG